MTAVMFGFVFAQSPIIRVKQIGEWKTPEYWWKAQETLQLQTFLADDTSAPAFKNNNFEVTIGIDHELYSHNIELSKLTRVALISDFS